jgi:PAS domain S-box-containing protein
MAEFDEPSKGQVSVRAGATPGVTPLRRGLTAPEQALRESEDRYRRLVEMCPDAVALHCEGRIVFANTAAAMLLGAERKEDLIGKPILDIVHPDYHHMVLERVRAETVQGQAVPLVEERFVRLDGSVIDVEVAGIPFTYEGRPAGQIVVRDVTERKKTEAALRRQNDYLAALHETALALVDHLEVSSLLEAILSRAAALAGTDHAYIYLVDPDGSALKVEVGLGAFEAFVGNLLEPGEGLAGKVWRTGAPLSVADYDTWDERSPTFPHGVLRAALAVPLTSAGVVVGVIGLAHVVPGVVFGSDEMDVLTRFGHLASIALDNARALEREHEAARRLRALDELRTTFLHAVSHELRTPLSAILGLATTLERHEAHLTPDESHQLVMGLGTNARKLERLLSDLLDIDRLDRGIIEPRLRLIDVGELVQQAVAQTEGLSGREIHVSAPPTLAEVDGPKVERIVENLLANVARHTRAETRVWVRVEAADDGVLIAVEDDGPGVPESLRASIFEPFSQGAERVAHSPGVGVGLSLVERFAELHGGRAWVQDRPGGGASFQVYLPNPAQPFSTGAPTSDPYSVQDPS